MEKFWVELPFKGPPPCSDGKFGRMRRIELYESIPSNNAAVQWTRARGLLHSAAVCPVCASAMQEIDDACADGRIWQCRRTTGGVRHKKKLSIRHGSIFYRSSLTVREIIFLLYEWSISTSIDQAAYQLVIGKRAVARWYRKFRKIASRKIAAFGAELLGTEGDIIEIDEAQIGRRKHHRGRAPSAVWLFGAFVRSSNPPAFFLERVAKRDKQTLEGLIIRRVTPGSRIVSDGWGAYGSLHALGFDHAVVNHSENFVSPDDSQVHTQNIENLWRCLRRFLSSRSNYSRKRLMEYVNEFTFRKCFIDTFEMMLSVIDDQQ